MRTRLLLLFVFVATPAFAKSAPRTWQAEGGWTVTATPASGKAVGPGGKTRTLWKQPRREKGCDQSLEGHVRSIVGTLVSFETSAGGYCEGAAHPYAYRVFQTTDLASGKGVTLFDVFGKPQVEAALARDAFLQKSKDDPDADCKFTTSGYESSFAFFDVKDGKAAVRVGLTHGCEAMRGTLTQLGWWLTPKPELLARIQAAAQAGTLMKHLERP